MTDHRYRFFSFFVKNRCAIFCVLSYTQRLSYLPNPSIRAHRHSYLIHHPTRRSLHRIGFFSIPSSNKHLRPSPSIFVQHCHIYHRNFASCLYFMYPLVRIPCPSPSPGFANPPSFVRLSSRARITLFFYFFAATVVSCRLRFCACMFICVSSPWAVVP